MPSVTIVYNRPLATSMPAGRRLARLEAAHRTEVLVVAERSPHQASQKCVIVEPFIKRLCCRKRRSRRSSTRRTVEPSIIQISMATPLASRLRDQLRIVVQALRREYLRRVWQIEIGEGSVISLDATIDKTNPQGIHIGRYTAVAFGSAILAHDSVNNRNRDVHIGDNCFIGAHAIILPGVTVGDNCIVSAGSVVVTNVPAGSLVTGNPARIVEKNLKTGPYGYRIQPH
jgi:acetyltransferase-like isoleucine patch superfamily enzyme